MTSKIEDKKIKILEILTVLKEENIWDFASPLIVFIKNSKDINEELLDAVLQIINNSISETKDKVKLEKLKKTKTILEWIKEEEKNEKNIEKKEADKLLDSIDF